MVTRGLPCPLREDAHRGVGFNALPHRVSYTVNFSCLPASSRIDNMAELFHPVSMGVIVSLIKAYAPPAPPPHHLLLEELAMTDVRFFLS